MSSPPARWKDLCIDATDPDRLGRFWARALGLSYVAQDGGDAELCGSRPEQTVWVNRVPEPRTVKQRIHVDVEVGSLQPLLDAGATVQRPEGDDGIHWTVMADPEGGEVCAFVRDTMAPDATPRPYELIVDSRHHGAQAEWWADVLGADVTHDERGFSFIERVPGLPFDFIDFGSVPEPKTVKNRIHWDVVAADVEALVARGATVLRAPDDEVSWHVLADPEGNEFCVFPPGTPESSG